ncbi:unnamed protein product [Mortierella alpina]
MSQRKGAANSKFGHLFGDTSDSSTGSSKSSRLSISGDLYKDPLAAFNPPVSVPTTTTRGGAAAVKATLSSPPVSSSAAAAAAAAAGSKTPPGSGSNSRSSSRLQHHTLFSSLTGDTGGSLFDSAPQSASLTLSAAKRDLLFGDSGGPTSSSSASRKTSTAISRNSASSSRVPSPPLGVRVSTTTLNPDASPLGESTSNTNNKDEDTQSIKSPLSTQPLTRTNSQASTISHESVKSSRSVQSQEITDDARSIASSTRPIIPSKTASVVSSSVAPPASAPPLSSKPSTSTRPAAIKRASVDQPSKQSNPTAPTIVDPIFNPLDRRSPSPSSEPQSPRVSKERIHHSASSTTSSQSIETFQSISRTSSPNIAAPPLSKNGFERDAENASPALGSRSSRPEAMNLAIPDDAAEAFANDLMFTSGPTSPPISSTLGHRSTSFLDSGIASSRSQHQPSIADALGNSNPLRSTVTTSVPGLGAGTVNHPRTGSGFSLGEDVVDSSNPWMNSLADSLQETKLRMVEGGGSKAMMDYTQSDDMSGPMFAQEDAFTLPSTSALSRSSLNSSTGHRNNTTHSTGTTTTNGSIGGHYPSSFVTPIPRLEEEMGGFDDVFSSSRSKSNSSSAGAAMATPTLALSTNWNIRDAVEAAALDPDFQGPRSIVNQSREKVLAIMQMPKDPLEKDAADQEAFDNPWE